MYNVFGPKNVSLLVKKRGEKCVCGCVGYLVSPDVKQPTSCIVGASGNCMSIREELHCVCVCVCELIMCYFFDVNTSEKQCL